MKWLELSHELPANLYPTAIYWLSVQHVAKVVGINNKVIACWYTNHECSYLVTPNAFITPGQKILQELKQYPKLLDKIIKVNKTEIPHMLKAAKKLSGAKVKKLTNRQMYQAWQDWLDHFLKLMTYSAMGTVLEMEQPILSNELEKILIKKLGKDNSKTGNYFQILTTSTQATIAGYEEIDLLKLRLKTKLTQAEIKRHVKKYSHIAFGYDGPGWSEKDIKNRLSQLPKNKNKLNKLLIEKTQAPKILSQHQKEIEKELDFNKQEKYLFHILRTLGFWKFERKFKNQKAHEMMEDFIAEVARRNNLSIAQVKMIAPNEMKKVLVDNIVNSDLLNERIKESVVIYKGTNYQVLSGKKVKAISREIKKSLTVNKNIKKLTGTTAYPGKVRGVVKIVDVARDMVKLKKGDILVSMSTSPYIISAMKRAGAVVTNSGGITCHAAIVAREIKVPTVIGTKIATKVLKDGDKVEVDASSGIIRKL